MERHEIKLIWTIDRSEIIHNIYYLINGMLVLRPEYYDAPGWPPGEEEQYTPILEDCYDRGGTFIGAFVDDVLVGIMVLESRFIGKNSDQLQLKFLHVSRNHRKGRLGRQLFEQAVYRARELKARKLYISATPSENTVNFYLHLGCTVAEEINEELFELEPLDIHLEFQLD